MINPVEDQEEGEVKVVLNNVADRSTVAAERAGARHPLWMIGTTITDAYELSMFITMQGELSAARALNTRCILRLAI